MNPLSHHERRAALTRMAGEGVDVLVIGGGITGAGVALDAAARGYRVGLVEKGDFGSGTSSKSTKLVHGGIRYLPQFDFGLVHEALVERGLLSRNAPFLVRRLGFILPLYKENKRPLGTPIVPPGGLGMSYMLQSGLLLYDLLAGRLGLGRHRRLGPQIALRHAPCLKSDGLLDAFLYYDGQTDDTRLTTTVLRTAHENGALLTNYTEVTGFTQAGGRITHATVYDRLSDISHEIKVDKVVNAGGVFAGRIEALAGPSHLSVKPAKGAHLTLPRRVVKIGQGAIVLPETEDGRLLFLVPWGPRVTVGTTDTEGGDIDRPTAGTEDVAYILRHLNRYLQCRVTEADIISTWAGYRPLVSSKDPAASSAKLSRTHAVLDGPGGMTTIVGGKLTTYRRMAQDTVDHLARAAGQPVRHVTEHLQLAGSDGWQEMRAVLQEGGPRHGLQPATLARLSLYGSGAQTILDLLAGEPGLAARLVPDLPYIMAEVVFACRYELALTLDDVLARRLHILFEDWAGGRDCAPTVAARMGQELGWDAAEQAAQLHTYQQLYAARRDEGAGERG